MAKPHPSSVTSVPCKCGFLERSAKMPDLPIVFDSKTNEFHFKYSIDQVEGNLVIYHCPFCGGAAPKSIRDSLFAVVSTTETIRLNGILEGIKTLDDALKKFGPPADDFPKGESRSEPEKEGEPPSTRFFRVFVYRDLSKTVDVYFTDYHRDRVGVRYQGKYLGSNKALRKSAMSRTKGRPQKKPKR